MDWIANDQYLTVEQMQNNADIIITNYQQEGLPDEVIASLLANFETESTINPGLTERGGGGGYGLIQWTPESVLIQTASNLGYSNYNNGTVQLECIISEIEGTKGNNKWYSTEPFISNYYSSGATSKMIGVTGKEYLTNSVNFDVEELTILFMVCRERPSYDPNTNHVADRIADSQKWLTYIKEGSFYEYTPRLDDSGIINNPYYYDLNPFYQSGFGLPNCTCYAWGRRYEITGEKPTTSLQDAKYWWQYNIDNNIYPYGQIPKLGAIACFDHPTFGHVGIVEQIEGDTITTSNSAFGGQFFYLETLIPPYNNGTYSFLGFIYLDGSIVPPTPKKKGYIVQWLLKILS